MLFSCELSYKGFRVLGEEHLQRKRIRRAAERFILLAGDTSVTVRGHVVESRAV